MPQYRDSYGGGLAPSLRLACARGEKRALRGSMARVRTVSYTHLRAHETVLDLVCRLLLETKTRPHNADTLDNETVEYK